jgi:hypothetical protein
MVRFRQLLAVKFSEVAIDADFWAGHNAMSMRDLEKFRKVRVTAEALARGGERAESLQQEAEIEVGMTVVHDRPVYHRFKPAEQVFVLGREREKKQSGR